MGKPNPHRIDLLPAIGISRVHQSGIKKAACHSEAEPLWEELVYLHWISTSQQSMFSQKVGYATQIVWATLQVAQTVQVNYTPLLAHSMEKSVDWDWSLEYHQVEGTYGR